MLIFLTDISEDSVVVELDSTRVIAIRAIENYEVRGSEINYLNVVISLIKTI